MDFNQNFDGEQKKINPLGIAIVIVFVLFLIVSVFLIKSGKTGIGAFSFGMMFIVLSVLLLISTKFKHWFPYVFGTVGLLVAGVAAVYTWGDVFFGAEKGALIRDWFAEKGMPLGISGLFILVGLSLSLGSLIGNTLKKKRCTVETQAICIELKMHFSRSNGHTTRTYMPVFAYYYDGQEYHTSTGTYSNVAVPTVDNEYTIYINPDKPDEMYLASDGNRAFVVIFGLIFAAFGVIALFASTSAS